LFFLTECEKDYALKKPSFLNFMKNLTIKKEMIIEIICFLFIVLFVYAATMKLMDVEKFRVQIGQSPLLTAFAPVVAWVIPLSEIVIAGMLAFHRTRMVGLYAAFSLMVMFTAYIIAILNFSQYIPCSCGGVLEKLGWTEHLIFNIGFVLLGIVGIILHSKKETSSTGNTSTSTPSFSDGADYL
jgi:uncharacterized membrane protein YphA (DoxX/SURF4 family)